MKVALYLLLAVAAAFLVFAVINANKPDYPAKTRAKMAIEECRKTPDLLGACAMMEDEFRRKFGRAP